MCACTDTLYMLWIQFRKPVMIPGPTGACIPVPGWRKTQHWNSGLEFTETSVSRGWTGSSHEQRDGIVRQ
jgi:hypothetical protein